MFLMQFLCSLGLQSQDPAISKTVCALSLAKLELTWESHGNDHMTEDHLESHFQDINLAEAVSKIPKILVSIGYIYSVSLN